MAFWPIILYYPIVSLTATLCLVNQITLVHKWADQLNPSSLHFFFPSHRPISFQGSPNYLYLLIQRRSLAPGVNWKASGKEVVLLLCFPPLYELIELSIWRTVRDAGRETAGKIYLGYFVRKHLCKFVGVKDKSQAVSSAIACLVSVVEVTQAA